MNPLVSIVVPIFNGEKHIGQCMEALLRQPEELMEIVLVNDGSSDRTAELCERYAADNANVVVVNKDNQGPGATRNYGVDVAKGQYIWFVDVDDSVLENSLITLVNEIKISQAEVILFGFQYCSPSEGKLICNCAKEAFQGSRENFFKKEYIWALEHEFINAPWNKLIKKDLLVKNKIRFDEEGRIFEDLLFSTQVIAKCNTIRISTGVFYKYILQTSGNLLSSFQQNTYEMLGKFYLAAKQYCSEFEDNEEQMKCIKQLFVRQTIAFVKKVCNTKTMQMQDKLQLLNSISKDRIFLEASETTELSRNKNLICSLLRRGCARSCYWVYVLQSKLK